MRSHTVSQVARIARVTVRTLHHYDQIGLLVPSGRSEGGYRLYADSDLERLQQILLFRELGFSLEEIRRVLDDPKFDRREALRFQREMLLEQQKKNEAMVRAIDAALAALEGETMEPEKMFEGFEEEARARWGDTEAFKESMRRTKRYRAEDWAKIRAEDEENLTAMAALLAAGAAPDSEEAMELAERLRLHIDRWYYPCDHRMHASLAEMYVVDPRFTETYEKRAEGLAAFVSEAIRASSARRGGSGRSG